MKHKLEIKPITYQEIQAYLDLTGNHLYAWEVEALKVLDTAYITTLMELQNGERSRTGI